MRRPASGASTPSTKAPGDLFGADNAGNNTGIHASSIAIFASSFWSQESSDAAGTGLISAGAGKRTSNETVDSQARTSKEGNSGVLKDTQLDCEKSFLRGRVCRPTATFGVQAASARNQLCHERGQGSASRDGDFDPTRPFSGIPGRPAQVNEDDVRLRAGVVPQGSTGACVAWPRGGRRSVAQPVAWPEACDTRTGAARLSGPYGGAVKRTAADSLAFLDTESTQTPSASSASPHLSEADAKRASLSCGGNVPSTAVDEAATFEKAKNADDTSANLREKAGVHGILKDIWPIISVCFQLVGGRRSRRQVSEMHPKEKQEEEYTKRLTACIHLLVYTSVGSDQPPHKKRRTRQTHSIPAGSRKTALHAFAKLESPVPSMLSESPSPHILLFRAGVAPPVSHACDWPIEPPKDGDSHSGIAPCGD
ncbi:conserved hypothetical protein [Neospora caninum Liverpool]|uniref:Uncharacterized protein n=1 Tax=Neospora caninum (strain Liverpool) TaxID=572307 RepID=F0VCK1_NEOCL|nr:conserved hypothetical protein [Neospora caninum Liverpool]CBZ51690.1 conserved hypothetical protein [Neospora caninum Liverpool]|eukprot:XP_003881723.1 conserved hypothetical protein [Neospora caninum Liverpool]